MKGHILQITPDQENILYQNVQWNFLRKLKNNLNGQQTLEMIVLNILSLFFERSGSVADFVWALLSLD